MAVGSRQDKETDGLQDSVVHIARVAKVVKGGRRFSFSALVVVGDGKNRVSFGVGKAGEVPEAIRKASEQAKKTLKEIPLTRGTIPYEVVGRFGATKVSMFPAKKGKGIIAGGAVRTIVELGGLQDIVCKIHGSKNNHNVVRATMNGLQQLGKLETFCNDRSMSPEELLQFRHKEDAAEVLGTTPVAEAPASK